MQQSTSSIYDMYYGLPPMEPIGPPTVNGNEALMSPATGTSGGEYKDDVKEVESKQARSQSSSSSSSNRTSVLTHSEGIAPDLLGLLAEFSHVKRLRTSEDFFLVSNYGNVYALTVDSGDFGGSSDSSQGPHLSRSSFSKYKHVNLLSVDIDPSDPPAQSFSLVDAMYIINGCLPCPPSQHAPFRPLPQFGSHGFSSASKSPNTVSSPPLGPLLVKRILNSNGLQPEQVSGRIHTSNRGGLYVHLYDGRVVDIFGHVCLPLVSVSTIPS